MGNYTHFQSSVAGFFNYQQIENHCPRGLQMCHSVIGFDTRISFHINIYSLNGQYVLFLIVQVVKIVSPDKCF